MFKKGTEKEKQEKVTAQFSKYLDEHYTKDLLENIEFKLVIKDTTLINSILEQSERYLFTQSNSHLLKIWMARVRAFFLRKVY